MNIPSGILYPGEQAPCKILVIDDHESLRRNIVALLADEGFDVMEAASGEDALDVLDQRPADLAIVDIRLPGISGDDFIAQAAPRYPELRFIVHTGSVDYVLSEEAVRNGLSAQDLFFKPIGDIETFFTRIRALCAGKKRSIRPHGI